ncbi:MAG: hypothetical protein JKY37_27585 [Nannocystaceae bacterium]|nr:hypothetical protein [Nannocystaceae bacterium]
MFALSLGCGGDDSGGVDTEAFVPTGTGDGSSNASESPDDDGEAGPDDDSAASNDDTDTSDSTNPDTSDDGTAGDTDTGPVGGPAGSCGMGGETGSIVQIDMGSPERWYLIGAHDTDEPLPLVLAFHGDEGDPFMSTRYIWGSYWEQEQPPFIAVMTKCPGCTSWYQGDTSANADYVWDVLADVAANHNVDVSRIYAVGYSGGSEFLAIHGWEFQDVFAGIQWTCGGNAYTPYMPPSRDDCKVHGRIVISQDDFLWEGAQNLLARLQDQGHPHEYVDAQCSGHCCDTPDLNVGAWEWFQTVTKCDGIVPGECTELNTLPPAPLDHDPGAWVSQAMPSRPVVERTERALPFVPAVSFTDATAEFDAIITQLEAIAGAPTLTTNGEPELLLRRAVAAYDTMLAAAHSHGEGAKDDLSARHPRLRALMATLRE